MINEHLKEKRDRYNEVRADESLLHKELKKGAEKAKALAHPTLNRVRNAVGFR